MHDSEVCEVFINGLSSSQYTVVEINMRGGRLGYFGCGGLIFCMGSIFVNPDHPELSFDLLG